MRFRTCIEHHPDFCSGCIFPDHWLVCHVKYTVPCRTVRHPFLILSLCFFFMIPLLFWVATIFSYSSFSFMSSSNFFSTLFRRCLLCVSLVSANFRPGIHGTLTSYLPSACLEMCLQTLCVHPTASSLPGPLLLIRLDCTIAHSHLFLRGEQAAIYDAITAMNDPAKSRPFNYGLPRLPCKNILCRDSTICTFS